jgi:hypothetical protein
MIDDLFPRQIADEAWTKQRAGGRPMLPFDRAWSANPEFQAEAERIARPAVTLDDFYAYMPSHQYIYAPTRDLWPATSVNARIAPIPLIASDGTPLLDDKGKPRKTSAAGWLDHNRPVEMMTWAPGEPTLIRDKFMLEGGWIERPGAAVFNLYYPPDVDPGNPEFAGRWIEHVRFVYPDEADHIIDWLAHRVQRPQQKINHAIVLGGSQGIGKDSLLEPVKYAIGAWNFREASPVQMLGRFNGFLKAVILRISEARDLGEFDRFQFYDHLKAYTAAPPDTLRVDEKNLREYQIQNCCGVIITTNHKTDGIYLPPDDRRHFVCWSSRTKHDPEFQNGYWRDLYGWYRDGGMAHVAAYLQRRDISAFDPNSPPPITEAFWAIVTSNQAPEEAELNDLIDSIGKPRAFTLSHLLLKAESEFAEWAKDRRNRRVIPHRLERCGYVSVRNPEDKHDGQWRINGKRQTVYAKQTLSFRDQIAAAREL